MGTGGFLNSSLPANLYEVIAPESGYITKMDAEKIGLISVTLGAGRATKEEAIDYSAGIRLVKKVGEYVEKGDVLALLYTNRAAVVEDAGKRYLEALSFGQEKPEEAPLVYRIITK